MNMDGHYSSMQKSNLQGFLIGAEAHQIRLTFSSLMSAEGQFARELSVLI